MSSDAHAYGVIGYKLDNRSCLYKPRAVPTKKCCEYQISGHTQPKFCPECGTKLEQFKLNRIDEYDGESLFDINVFDRHYYTDDMDLSVILYYTNVAPSSPPHRINDDMKKLDISKMDESKEKIKNVLDKLGITFEEERFGVWVISYLSC